MSVQPEIPQIERVDIPNHEDNEPKSSLTFSPDPVRQDNTAGIKPGKVLYVILLVVIGIAKLLSRAATEQRVESGAGSTSAAAPISITFENDLFSLSYPNTWSVVPEADYPAEYASHCQEAGVECQLILLNNQTEVSIFIFRTVDLNYIFQSTERLAESFAETVTDQDGTIISQWQRNINFKVARQVTAEMPNGEVYSFLLLKDHPNSVIHIVVSAGNRAAYERTKRAVNGIITSIHWLDAG